MVKPYKESQETKKEQVATMFNNIAWRYDFLNHFFSLGIDKIWRKKAVKVLKKNNPKNIIDLAAGTGDFALEAVKCNPDKIIAVDIAEKMLEKARIKIIDRNLSELITTQLADAENLPFDDSVFDGMTIGFGVRNFENLHVGLKEMCRVLQENGIVCILEFSIPKNWLVRGLYNFYFSLILPFFGKLISKDKHAYSYLPESVKAFPERQNFISKMEDAGFKKCYFQPLTMGIACLYVGYK